MGKGDDEKSRRLIADAFEDDEGLKAEIERAVARTPEYLGLFGSIGQFVLRVKSPSTAAPGGAPPPPSKKRRLDVDVDDLEDSKEQRNGTVAVGRTHPHHTLQKTEDTFNGQRAQVLELKDEFSFSVPRKKLKLECTEAGIRGRKHVLCVPVPEKAQRQFNFCVFPKYADGVTQPPKGEPPTDAIVWTIPDAPPKDPETISFRAGKGDVEGLKESYKSILTHVFNNHLPKGTRVVEPDRNDFASALVQAHRKDEKAVHVRAFRGSKEGYLFFLPTGVLWAFKKPLLFFSFANVSSISYTSVLQRTFNLNLSATTTSAGDDNDDDGTDPTLGQQDFEFSMIDQADHPGIDEYVRRHGLHDASMAEQRRARRLNVNPPTGDGEHEEEDGEGEIDKAVREMQPGELDAEEGDEEEEEDYDPGSEGESEGEGSDSTEGEGEGEGDEGEGEGEHSDGDDNNDDDDDGHDAELEDGEE
ncbi:MAG: hypothetical protein M1837_000842 [Sclerophora amabilis]|nr:MAG: hypothetical protein M1837_000842 [Sclerophora amabilis]